MKTFVVSLSLVLELAMGGSSVHAVEPVLNGKLAALDPWVGTWQFDGQWSSGDALWSQAEYVPLLGGSFLEGRVFVRDNGGELYQRYRTVFKWSDESDVVEAHTFNHDGSYSVSTLVVDGVVATTEWSSGEVLISERMAMESADAMRWRVWADSGDGDRAQMMDGVWQRIEVAPIDSPEKLALTAGLAALAPLIGGWEISSQWADGTPLWARAEYRRGNAGRFVEASTWSVDDEGNGYQRYETIFTADASEARGSVVTFDFNGGVSIAEWEETKVDENRGLRTIGAAAGGGELLQELGFVSPSAHDWRVARRDTNDQPWNEIIKGLWRSQGTGKERSAIDPNRFAAGGTDLRSFSKERIISAPVEEVFAAWTNGERWSSLWGPRSVGRFELAIGGRYEWLFNGWLGGNGSQVLSYIPGRMVSFSWNAPPSLPNARLMRTWVVVETETLDEDKTRLQLTHLGFGEGPEWDETFAYFDAAWDRVLELMAGKLGQEKH